MALSVWRTISCVETNLFTKYIKGLRCVRHVASLPNVNVDSALGIIKEKKKARNSAHLDFRYMFPEFLPDPNPKMRNSMREKLERLDMLARRTVIELPEFYVGSVLAVSIADPHAQGKMNRFVGICTERCGGGLRAEFTLRNVIDHQGIEVRYFLYDPLIQTIQVLRLEKRLDDCLRYLRDAPPEYSTFSFDMEPEILPEGVEVPVNRIQVPLKPKPWLEKWQRQNLKGVIIRDEHVRHKDKIWMEKHSRPFDKYDLMKKYRETIPEEEQSEIWSEVYSQLHQLETSRRKTARKRTFVLPKKLA